MRPTILFLATLGFASGAFGGLGTPIIEAADAETAAKQRARYTMDTGDVLRNILGTIARARTRDELATAVALFSTPNTLHDVGTVTGLASAAEAARTLDALYASPEAAQTLLTLRARRPTDSPDSFNAAIRDGLQRQIVLIRGLEKGEPWARALGDQDRAAQEFIDRFPLIQDVDEGNSETGLVRTAVYLPWALQRGGARDVDVNAIVREWDALSPAQQEYVRRYRPDIADWNGIGALKSLGYPKTSSTIRAR